MTDLGVAELPSPFAAITLNDRPSEIGEVGGVCIVAVTASVKLEHCRVRLLAQKSADPLAFIHGICKEVLVAEFVERSLRPALPHFVHHAHIAQPTLRQYIGIARPLPRLLPRQGCVSRVTDHMDDPCGG